METPWIPSDQPEQADGEGMESPPIRPALLISDAAKECQVSKTTIRRSLDAGAFPNAWREDSKDGPRTGPWHIPVVDLLQGGFRLNHSVERVEPVHEQGSGHPGGQGVETLERQLIRAESERDMYRAIADERAHALEDLRMAMRVLEAGAPTPAIPPAPVPRPDLGPDPVKTEPPRRRWFRRSR